LVQGFKSNVFEFQTKDNLGSNKGFWDRGNLNSAQDLNSKEYLNIFEEWEHNMEGFEILSEIKN
jgi:hypothetical protein